MPLKNDGTRRPVLSCTRCRKKKIKCDKSMPCSQCRAAKEPCSGFKSQEREDIPRSISQFLEEDIARLEIERDNRQNVAAEVASQRYVEHNAYGLSRSPDNAWMNLPLRSWTPSPTHGHQNSTSELRRDRIRASESMQSVIAATLPPKSTAVDMARMRISLTPSLALIQKPQHELYQRSAYTIPQHSDGLDVKCLSSIPPQVARILVKSYFDRVHNILPLLHEGLVWAQVHRVLDIVHSSPLSALAVDYDFLVTYLVLAISVMLGSTKDGSELRRMSFSENLFREGIQHLSIATEFPSTLAEVQVLLLLEYYGTINPKCVCVWMLSGAAMRACIELGLHRKTSEDRPLDALALDMQRRTFWSAYAADQQTCAILHRPISLSYDSTDAPLFSPIEDSHITPDGVIPGGVTSKEAAHHWIEFRDIVSCMVDVQFQGKTLPQGMEWESWVVTMEARLSHWHENQKLVKEWSEALFLLGRQQLHRPSPRNPLPSSASLLIAFDSACSLAAGFKDNRYISYLCHTWAATHNIYGSALIALFCLRHGSSIIASKYNAEEVFDMTKTFTMALLGISSKYWQDASQYATTYERLLAPLIGAFISTMDCSNAFSIDQDAELERLMFPGAFRGGSSRLPKSNLSLGQPTLEQELFNFDMVAVDLDAHLDQFNWEEMPID